MSALDVVIMVITKLYLHKIYDFPTGLMVFLSIRLWLFMRLINNLLKRCFTDLVTFLTIVNYQSSVLLNFKLEYLRLYMHIRVVRYFLLWSYVDMFMLPWFHGSAFSLKTQYIQACGHGWYVSVYVITIEYIMQHVQCLETILLRKTAESCTLIFLFHWK